MLACLTAACLLPERAEEPAQPDQPENPTEPEKPGRRRQALRRRDRSLCPGGSQSDGQTGRITGEPGDGAGVLYLKKERDE